MLVCMLMNANGEGVRVLKLKAKLVRGYDFRPGHVPWWAQLQVDALQQAYTTWYGSERKRSDRARTCLVQRHRSQISMLGSEAVLLETKHFQNECALHQYTPERRHTQTAETACGFEGHGHHRRPAVMSRSNTVCPAAMACGGCLRQPQTVTHRGTMPHTYLPHTSVSAAPHPRPAHSPTCTPPVLEFEIRQQLHAQHLLAPVAAPAPVAALPSCLLLLLTPNAPVGGVHRDP